MSEPITWMLSWGRRLFSLAVPISAWLFAAGTAWAQEGAGAQPKGGSWALAYILVILAVVLGLAVVCRPGRRTRDVKRPE